MLFLALSGALWVLVHTLSVAKDFWQQKINVVKRKHQLQFHLACRDPHIFLLSKTKNSMFVLKLSLI